MGLPRIDAKRCFEARFTDDLAAASRAQHRAIPSIVGK
jgi:hypothetical protein